MSDNDKATWGNERTLSDRQYGRPVGLFRLKTGPSNQEKKYTVKILSIEAADKWCSTAREIVQEGDLIPGKLALERARRESVLALRRTEIDKEPEVDQIESFTDIRRQEFDDERALDILTASLQKEYMAQMCDHLFEYDPVAIPRDEIMAGNPDYSMLVSAFMRLWRFTDPSSCLATVIGEFAATK